MDWAGAVREGGRVMGISRDFYLFSNQRCMGLVATANGESAECPAVKEIF